MKYPQHRPLAFIFLALTVALSSCQTAAPPSVGYQMAADGNNITTMVVSKELTTEQVRDAVTHSLLARSWTVQQQSPNEIQASLNHRRVEAHLDIEISDGEIRIVSDSKDDRGVAIVPVRWINFLTQDIRARLTQELTAQ